MAWVILSVGVVALPIGLVMVVFDGEAWGWAAVAVGVAGVAAPFWMR